MTYDSDQVIKYYNKTTKVYEKWSKEHMHYGFWNKDIRNLEEALVECIKCAAECMQIQKEDIVLDAGCGVGGASRYISSQYGVKTIGITISQEQVNRANELTDNSKNILVEFVQEDYRKTSFANEKFSKILAIESVWYSDPLEAFLEEAYRILKKGGKFVVIDAFRVLSELNEKQLSKYNSVLGGWYLAGIVSREKFKDTLEKIGFSNIQYDDKKDEIKKSIELIDEKSKKWYRKLYVLSKLRLVPKEWFNHVSAGYAQKYCFENNIVTYGIFTAEKN